MAAENYDRLSERGPDSVHRGERLQRRADDPTTEAVADEDYLFGEPGAVSGGNAMRTSITVSLRDAIGYG